MNSISPGARLGLVLCLGLAGCGCGGQSGSSEPVNTDYSLLRVAEARDGTFTYASSEEQLLGPLKNGVRISLGGVVTATSAVTPVTSGSYSGTTVQVDAVDEADPVKYDGQYIYAVRTEPAPPSFAPVPGQLRNVLKIVSTDPASAGFEPVSEFMMAGQFSSDPLIYQLPATGAAHYLVSVSQNYQAWLLPQTPTIAVVPPDRTTIQMLDVSDPYNVSQAWQLQLDGWLRASRKIGDTLYVVTSYRPRLAGIVFGADSVAQRQANELRIRGATAEELLPHYSENDAALRTLVRPGDCIVAADVRSNEGFTDLTVITAIDLTQRRISDVNCLNSNINGVYMSTQSLYVGGESQGAFTLLHKFSLDGTAVSYSASGAVVGSLGWSNPSYFMDEHDNDLRIVTTQQTLSGGSAHHLSVLREAAGRRLALLATLPNTEHPEPIGKPNEQVRAVRFIDARAYIVTALASDPLYVLDLNDPAQPLIAGELEIPGFSTYLRPLGSAGAELLLAIGQQTTASGLRQGVKVELFDVHDISQPRSIDAQIFGQRGSLSAAVDNPHALALLTLPGDPVRYRLALPIDVFDTPHPTEADRFTWTYSGQHLFEISGIASGAPQLHFQGVLQTAQPDATYTFPPYGVLERSVLHDDSVFAIRGADIHSSLWEDLHGN